MILFFSSPLVLVVGMCLADVYVVRRTNKNSGPADSRRTAGTETRALALSKAPRPAPGPHHHKLLGRRDSHPLPRWCSRQVSHSGDRG